MILKLLLIMKCELQKYLPKAGYKILSTHQLSNYPYNPVFIFICEVGTRWEAKSVFKQFVTDAISVIRTIFKYRLLMHWLP